MAAICAPRGHLRLVAQQMKLANLDEALIKAASDFTPLPVRERHSPGRIKSIPARLYVDKFQEHAEAFEFLQEAQSAHGLGAKTLVKALLHYRDSVAQPLEAALTKGRVPEDLLFARIDFTPFGPRASRRNRVKHVSARLYIDKWREHREAYEFLQEMQELHGEGNKTIVRALLHFRDSVWPELVKARRSRARRSK